jgi:site-specific recombinase XerD
MRELRNRNYARNSIKTYSSSLRRFLEFSRGTTYEPSERISRFLTQIPSPEARRLAWNAIKLFYTLVLNKTCPYTLDKVHQRRRLPAVLNREDVLNILEKISNPKHRLMISMLFGSGLRVGEVVRLKVKDIDFNSLTIRIVNAKQNKDRITVFAESLVEGLKEIAQSREGKNFLFVTRFNKPYTKRTVQAIFGRALTASNIKKEASCHTLRHSFATTLLANGIDIRSIKDLLGHKSVKTTMIYLHVTDRMSKRIKSPL